MTWSNNKSPRAARLPSNWQRLRTDVLRRDGYRCQALDALGWDLCDAPATHVDHVVPGDNHDPDNLQSMCAPCHHRKTSAEGLAARRAKRTRSPKGPSR